MSALTLVLVPGPAHAVPPAAVPGIAADVESDDGGAVTLARTLTVWSAQRRPAGSVLALATPTDRSGPAGGVAAYVAQAALQIHAAEPTAPLLLVGHGLAGPFLPALARTQTAAGRTVQGYLFVDALLPRPGGGTLRELLDAPEMAITGPLDAAVLDERLPPAPDWPDAPCGYLVTDGPSVVSGRAFWARSAVRRGWAVSTETGTDDVADLQAVLAAMPGVLG